MKTFPRLFGYAFLAMIVSCTLGSGNKQKAEVVTKEAKAGMVIKTAPIIDEQEFRKTLQALVETLKRKTWMAWIS